MFDLDERALAAWGHAIGRSVEPPAVFALRGDLGAGKSVLARAIAHGAGVTAVMPSPTFNLLFQYETPRAVVNHLDLYRLEDAEEVWELGWRELGDDRQIVLIEWPERAEELLPRPRWEIRIEPGGQDPLRRVVHVGRVGAPPSIPMPG